MYLRDINTLSNKSSCNIPNGLICIYKGKSIIIKDRRRRDRVDYSESLLIKISDIFIWKVPRLNKTSFQKTHYIRKYRQFCERQTHDIRKYREFEVHKIDDIFGYSEFFENDILKYLRGKNHDNPNILAIINYISFSSFLSIFIYVN